MAAGERSEAGLEEVRRCLLRRRRQGLGGRIPDRLWRMAAEAALVDGAEETAEHLQLDVARLKQWMRTVDRQKATLASTTKPPQAAPLFVELPPLAVGADAECTLKLEEPSGRQLRISLKGQATTQAVHLGCCGRSHAGGRVVDESAAS